MTSFETESKTLVLNRETLGRETPGFVRRELAGREQGALARTIASSFLRYTERGARHAKNDNVEDFLALHELFGELYEEAERFLKVQIPFVQENRAIHELLIAFAGWRLAEAGRALYLDSLSGEAPEAAMDATLSRLLVCHREFTALCQGE